MWLRCHEAATIQRADDCAVDMEVLESHGVGAANVTFVIQLTEPTWISISPPFTNENRWEHPTQPWSSTRDIHRGIDWVREELPAGPRRSTTPLYRR